jgi:SAM-dependent methyltransferase
VATGHRIAHDDARRIAAELLRPSRRLRKHRPLRGRAELTESLDGAVLDPAELERNLDDLARLGRLPGGVSTSLAAIRRLVPARADPDILDVGAGRGDMALAFASHGWRTMAVDTHLDVLRVARSATSHEPLVEVVQADGRHLPYPDHAFDVSHCALLIHHLDPADAVTVLRELARVARHGVVINDLRRGLLPFVATGVAVALLGRCRTTRVDGLRSVRRAYTLAELDALLTEAGLEVVWRSNRFMPRVVTAAVRRTGR